MTATGNGSGPRPLSNATGGGLGSGQGFWLDPPKSNVFEYLPKKIQNFKKNHEPKTNVVRCPVTRSNSLAFHYETHPNEKFGSIKGGLCFAVGS